MTGFIPDSSFFNLLFHHYSEEFGDSLLEHQHAVENAGGARLFFQQLQGLVHGLMREAEGAVVHGHHPAGLQVEEGADGVFRAGMDVAESGGL